METLTVESYNEETFEPWTLTIVEHPHGDRYFIESSKLNKAYDDLYFALREMLYEGLLTDLQYQNAVIGLMEDYESERT